MLCMAQKKKTPYQVRRVDYVIAIYGQTCNVGDAAPLPFERNSPSRWSAGAKLLCRQAGDQSSFAASATWDFLMQRFSVLSSMRSI